MVCVGGGSGHVWMFPVCGVDLGAAGGYPRRAAGALRGIVPDRGFVEPLAEAAAVQIRGRVVPDAG